MDRKFFITLCLCLLPFLMQAMSGYDWSQKTGKATIVMPDYSIEVIYLNKPVHINVKPNLRYAWYKGSSLLITRGGYDGKLVHGVYKEFYNDKNLKTKGQYHFGIKKGNWNAWYPDGEKSVTEHWSHGSLNGKFEEYSLSGNKVKQGKYKNGLLNGKLKEWKDGTLSITKWRAGKLIVKKAEQMKKGKQILEKKPQKTAKHDHGKRWRIFSEKVKNFFHGKKKNATTNKNVNTKPVKQLQTKEKDIPSNK